MRSAAVHTEFHGMSCPLHPPDWALCLPGPDASRRLSEQGDLITEVVEGARFSLISVCAADAHAEEAADFERRTAEAYRTLAAVVKTLATPHPVRFWNFIPHIHTRSATGLDRYRVFNAGRFRALADWFGEQSLSAHVATATGVGHHGRDLVIYALAAREPGRHLENPRQVPAFQYSTAYGPLPPCFARATWIADAEPGEQLLIAGTSSVRGDTSVHPNNVAAQTRETLDNLRSLISTAHGDSLHASDDLASLRHVRVYLVRDGDRPAVAAVLRDALSADSFEKLEYLQADLCRPELLIEIEGVADGSACGMPKRSAGMADDDGQSHGDSR